MLSEYEKSSIKNTTYSVQQPWSFTTKEGDVRCIAHIINLAVQSALASLKATPSEDTNLYRVGENAINPRLPIEEVLSALIKLRKHIYIFRNRRAWKEALRAQAIVMGIKPIQLSLDMPIRWSSTYYMLLSALQLQGPIIAHCAAQTLDLTIRDIALTSSDWLQLKQLEQFFLIFVRPSQKLQAEEYPTLNYAIPQYL